MKISVVLVVKNESKYIKMCLESVLRQSRQDFEVVVIDNGSTDGTWEIIRSIESSKIRSFRQSSPCGIAVLRNLGIKESIGEYVFFTDGDCRVNRYWLEAGMAAFNEGKFSVVEGTTFYSSQKKVTISDYDMHQFENWQFLTCNIAYARKVLLDLNCFDPRFRYGHEDRDLGLRASKLHSICFCPDMVVSHQKKRLTVSDLFQKTKRVEDKVYLIKKHGKNSCSRQVYKFILYPEHLAIILFPPLVFVAFSCTSFYDLYFAFFKYFSLIYLRLRIWKAAFNNRIMVM